MVIEYFSRACGLFKGLLHLILINIILSFLNFSEIIRVITFRGIHFGLKITFPTSIHVLWDFVSTPLTKSIYTGGFIGIILSITTLLLSALLAGGYIGVILRELNLKKPMKFIEYSVRYFPHILVYEVLIYALSLLLSFSLFISSVIFISTIFLFFILIYFIYATPFIIVIKDLSMINALRESMYLATKKSYIIYTLLYVSITLVISIPITLITVNLNILGIIIGSIIASIPSLILTIATTLMVIDISKYTITTN